MVEHPDFEPDMLYGGFPMKDLRCKFLMAPPSEPCLLTPECLPEGLEIIELPGHCFGMVGFRTSDDVVFLADALSSAETLVKYRLGFVYDLKAYFETLEMVKTIDASCFVPSHAPQTDNIVPLADLNIEKTKENAELILQLISTPKIFEDILTGVFNYFGIGMNVIQYVLVGSTVKSYLSWLKDTGKAEFYFENNRMLWKSI